MELPHDSERFLAVAAEVPDGGPGRVVVAGTLETVDESTGIVGWSLVGGIPALLVIVAA